MSNKLAIPKQLAQTQTDENGAQIIYTSPASGAGTVISAVTVTNNTLADHFYSAWIGGVNDIDLDGPVVPETTIKAKRSDNGAELIGHIIPPGKSLWVEDPFHVLLFTVTGRELIQ